MKKRLLTHLTSAVLLTVLPIIPAMAARGTEHEPVQNAQLPEFVEFTMETDAPAAPAQNAEQPYLVLDTASGEVMEVSVRDYVIGAVCAEMPASFEPEALKAQAVAAHTYAYRLALLAQAGTDESLKGAYFSNDSSRYQAFCTDAQIREAFGENYEAYYKKIADAVDAVLGEILLYEEKPIIAAFHAMSGGRTESAAHVWGTDVPYLVPVDSQSDMDAPLYEQTTVFSAQEVRTKLEGARDGLMLSGEPENWLSVAEVSESGTVLRLNAGNSIFTGQEVCSLFGLRSAAFSVEYTEEGFAFTTKGYGHHVGMSQYGANAMAQAGKTYREILLYYYPGAAIGKCGENR